MDTGDYEVPEDTGDEEPCESPLYLPDPFIQTVVSFSPGTGAGFGEDQLPGIVMGPPHGAGPNGGSLDVLSLGENGSIVLAFNGLIIDSPGPDLRIFENPFPNWLELGIVSASADGENWVSWPCDTDTLIGCAGIQPVLSHPDNCIDAQGPGSGGDAFDLSDIGLASALYIKIQDAGTSGPGGFDLDSVAIIHLEEFQ